MGGVSQQPRVVDYTPLHTPVGRWDAQYLVDQVKSQPAYSHWHLTRTSMGWAIAALVVLLAGEIALLSVFVTSAPGGRWTPGEIVLFAAGLALVLVTYASLTVTVVQGVLAGGRVTALAKLIRFANRNGLTYEPIAPNREYPGDRFAGLYLRDRIADPDGGFDYGQRLEPGRHGAYSGTAVGWYLALPLEKPLPHAVLTSARRATHDGGSPVPLEGPHGGRFALRCAPGGQEAALAVFTPEVLALLVDGRTTCDAEIIDRWLLIYPGRSTTITAYGREAFHRRMLRLATIAGETPPVRRGPRRDEVGADGDAGGWVDPPRRRLGAVGLLVALLLPVVIVAIPFWPAIAAAVSAAIG